ncbi:hypothetical protein AB1Y20_003480 [Prymnesium parvum]|uniref:Zn(2)-C6 fungal-type domain-containing protein n=1 Tax=Prymnesium parvum TaxID=97485 RepID=A0AB34JCE0_PRYPA|mmetsp:Transcript_25623/g.63395  ORF Transcript_25623/g.63395 Transcript_25623/m.63395 type:complete len:364 (+) Transcript_25623:19-1110(+)
MTPPPETSPLRKGSRRFNATRLTWTSGEPLNEKSQPPAKEPRRAHTWGGSDGGVAAGSSDSPRMDALLHAIDLRRGGGSSDPLDLQPPKKPRDAPFAMEQPSSAAADERSAALQPSPLPQPAVAEAPPSIASSTADGMMDDEEEVSSDEDAQSDRSDEERGGLKPASSAPASSDRQAQPALHRPCAACRAAKVKCSRHAPCTRCLRLSLVCTQPPVVQRGRPSHQSRLAQMRAVDTPSSDRPPSFSSLLPQQQMYAQSVPLPPMVQQQPWAILPPEAQQMMMLQQQMGGHALMAKRFAQMHVNQPAPLRISTKLEWSLLANSPLAGEEILGEVKQMERKYDEAQVSIDALRAQLLRLGVQPCI